MRRVKSVSVPWKWLLCAIASNTCHVERRAYVIREVALILSLRDRAEMRIRRSIGSDK